MNDTTKEGDFSIQGRGSIAARQQHGYIPVGDSLDNLPNEGPNTRFVSDAIPKFQNLYIST